jgi:hypothetical protein
LGAYRISRQLIPPAGYLETYAGRASGDKPVLLKRFTQSPSSVERLLENLRVTRGPGLAPVLELGSATDGLWLVSEANEGESLRWVMSTLARASGFIAPNEGLAVVARVANALDALHKQHLIHGDVCPATIFITPRGEVQLHDGGITPLLGAQGESGPARSELNALAPEQLTRAPGTSTDVFRLGLVLYELAVGRPLWSRPTAAQLFEVATSWQGLTREKVKQVPEPWLTLLVSMLSVEPDARPSMEEVIVVLEQAVQQHKWATTDDEIARLFARAATGRVSAFATDPSSMQELQLSALTPQVTPPASQPVARITTRKMTREMLAVVVRTASAPELPATDATLEARAAQLLVERGKLSRSRLAVAQESCAASGKNVTGVLVDDGAIDEDELVAAVAELSRTPAITFKKLAEAAPSAEALALVPFPLSRSARAVPLGLKGEKELLVAMADPMDVKALDELKASCGSKSLITFRAGMKALSAARARLYGASTTGAQPVVQPSPPIAPSPSGLSPKVIDALLGLHGTRGLHAQQLVKLAVGVSKRLGCSPGEQQLIGLASRAMVTAALLAGKAPHEVPRLAEVQERFGSTEADEFIEALQAFPARLPERTMHRAVALAFSFAAHSGEPKPSGSRLGGALSSFRTRLLLPQALFEALAVELSQ